MKILHVVESTFKYGGANVACIDFANLQAARGHQVALFSTYSDESLNISQELSMIKICRRIELPFGRLRYIKNLDSEFEQFLLAFKPDIVHVHALWDPIVHVALKYAHRYHYPIIHSTHGMLTPWALNNKKLKKKIAWSLYQKKDLLGVNTFHVTAQEEKNDLQSLGFKQNIEIIPLGIEAPSMKDEILKENKILFMSRVHPKKGVLDLVEAWDQIKDENWKIVICGPDDDNHLIEVRKKIKELKLEKFFIIEGPVSGMQKELLLRECRLFVLPTYSENFGIVILEALSYGMPVITTVGAPWKCINDYSCGKWTEIGTTPLVKALKELLYSPASTWDTMEKNARHLAINKYSWDIIIEQLIRVYSDTINKHYGK